MTTRIALCLAALVAATLIHLGVSSPLPFATKWALATSLAPDLFEEVRFYHSVLPRLAMALLAGAALGLSGAIMQEATQNRLASPMTLGISAGARVGLYAATVIVPGLAAAYGEWFALAGASATMALVFAIAGRQGIGGLPIVLAGMALNLLLSAVAVALIIMNEFYVRHLFVWGAGDLTQGAGFQGTGGVFRLRSNGTNERGLAIATIANQQVRVIDPAPRGFGGAGF